MTKEKLTKLRPFLLGFLMTLGGGALAATFNLFSPATGILVGNASSYVTTAATSSNVTGLWSGTCNSGTYLRGDGSCQTPPGTATGANPTATIGLTAVNGSAGTYLRSDGAPALSQAISPTWTGVHTFANTVQPSGTQTLGTSSTRWSTLFASAMSDGTNAELLDSTSTTARIARGTAWTALQFGNATSNPSYSFLGTGTTTWGGPITIPTASAWVGTIGLGGSGRLLLDNGGGSFQIKDSTDTTTRFSIANLTGATTITGTTANPLTLNSSGGSRILLNDTSAASISGLDLADNGTVRAYVFGVNAANAGCTGAAEGDLCLRSEAGNVRVSINGGASSSPVCTANGVNCPTGQAIAYGTLIVSGGTCTISTSYDRRNISACGYVSTGTYDMTFSIAAGTLPSCVVSIQGGINSGRLPSFNAVTATTGRVTISSLTSASPITWSVTDASFNIICLGG